MMGRILVVDDEPSARTALADLLTDDGFEVTTAADGREALTAYETAPPDVVITDLKMPGMGGIELLRELRRRDEPPVVIVVTAFGDVQTAIEAMRAGAADYLAKPLSFGELRVVIQRELGHRALEREASLLRRRVHDKTAPGNIIGTDPAMLRVFELVDHVASTTATVLISGESGTGKELVANAIHQRSPRANRPFVKLHCAALAESLLESELFGHEKGSFTGAVGRRDGRFSIADGGTLFLDEIGDISPAIQVKLLRFVQERQFERVGGTQTLTVDVRLIAATHKNLFDEVRAGRFREDLYYRLNVVQIDMPALRERKSDIPALVRFFIERYAVRNGKTIDAIAPDALEALVGYDWPGNVRELENAIERAVVMAPGTTLDPRHLPTALRPTAPRRDDMPAIPGASWPQIERYAILETLRSTGGSTSKAARILGISTRTIQYRLHDYNEAPRSAVASVGAVGAHERRDRLAS